MFSLFKSPKAILASYLAESLDVFFDVDPEQIESNLLTDTQIVLHNLHLKPQPVLNTGCILTGIVEVVEFKWTWGGAQDGSTAFVRETSLSIRGAHFKIAKQHGGDSDSTTRNSPSSAAAAAAAAAADLSPMPSAINLMPPPSDSQGYIQRNVQQIIDHLTLQIIDMELVIETTLPNQTGPKENLVVLAQSLKILSSGRERKEPMDDADADSNSSPSSSPLSQRISLESFGAMVEVITDEEENNNTDENISKVLNVIEPMTYNASIRRIGGRRFVDGIGFGLEVVGELQFQDDITIHAGKRQIQVLERILSALLVHDEVGTDNNRNKSTTDEGCTVCPMSESADHHPPINDDTPPPAGPTSTAPSTFDLPFPSITLIMPNGSSIRMPHARFSYCADGSKCHLEGSKGIFVSDHDFLRLNDGTHWVLDFLKRSFVLEPRGVAEEEPPSANQEQQPTTDQEVAKVFFSSHTKDLLNGVGLGSNIIDRDVIQNIKSSQHQGNTEAAPWSVSVRGSVALRVDETVHGLPQWLEASIDSPYLTLPAEGTKAQVFRFGGCSIGPSSIGTVQVHVPAVSLTKSAERNIFVQGTIQAVFESFSTLEGLKDIAFSALDVDLPLSNPKSKSHSESNVPFPLQISKLLLTFREPKVKAEINDIRVKDHNVSCRSAHCSGTDTPTVSLSGINLTQNGLARLEATVAQINSLYIPGLLELKRPICGITFSLRDDLLWLEVPSVNIRVLERIPSAVETQGESSASAVSLPFAVRSRVGSLDAELHGMQDDSVHLQSLDISLRPSVEPLADWMGLVQNGPAKNTFSVAPVAAGRFHISVSAQTATMRTLAMGECVTLKAGGLCFTESTLDCERLAASTVSGYSTNVLGVHACIEPNIKLTMDVTESLCVPQTMSLHEPIRSASIEIVDDTIRIDLSSVDAVCPMMDNKLQAYGGLGAYDGSCPGLPLAVHLFFSGLKLRKSATATCSATLSSIGVVVKPDDDGGLSVEVKDSIGFAVQDLTQGWLAGSIGPTSLMISRSLSMQSFVCSNCQIGHSSYGQMLLDVPAVTMPCPSVLHIADAACLRLDSVETCHNIYELISSLVCFEGPSDQLLWVGLQVSKLEIAVANIDIKVIAEQIAIDRDRKLCCQNLALNQSSGMAGSLSSLEVIHFGQEYVGNIGFLDSLYVPGSFALETPVQNAEIVFDGQTLRLNTPSIDLTLLPLVPNETATRQPVPTAGEYTIPFPVAYVAECINIRSQSNDVTSVYRLNACAKRVKEDSFSPERIRSGTTVNLKVGSFENKMLKVEDISISGLTYGNKFDAVYGFRCKVGSATIVSGFSSIDWLGALGLGDIDERESCTRARQFVLKLPFARIHPIKARLTYEGLVASAHNVNINIPAFHGSAVATTVEVTQHVKDSILKKAPNFIASTEVFGENISETAGKAAGLTVLGASSVAGGAMGSVAGLVGVDTVQGAIKLGKAARGANADRGYKFGDVTRGSIRAIGHAVSDPGNAAKTVGRYVGENTSRLAGAGGSGVGMVMGGALLGPVGMLVGSYVGSYAGSAVFEDEDEDVGSDNDGGQPLDSEPQSFVMPESESGSPATSTAETMARRQPGELQQQQQEGYQTGGITRQAPISIGVDSSTMTDPTCTNEHNGTGDIDPHLATIYASNQQLQQQQGGHPTGGTGRPTITCQAGYPQQQSPPIMQQQDRDANHHQVLDQRASPQPPRQRPYLQQQVEQQRHQEPRRQQRPPQYQQEQEDEEGYQFGDLTRSVVAKGKRQDGRTENDDYKFGDFTRGLFSDFW